MWAQEFLARYCDDPRSRFAWRAGAPGADVVEAATLEDVDLIAMSWSRNIGAGHASVVEEVLARSPIPVALLPAEPSTRAEQGVDDALGHKP